MKLYYKILMLTNCALTICSNIFSQSPTIQWQNALGGTSYDQGESIVQTFDGGFITAGIATSNNGDVTGNHGFGDFWIVKLDSSGILQWEKSYGGSADDGAFSIRQTADSGYIIAGTSTSTNGDVTTNHGFIDVWVVKIDTTGNLQWQKSYGGSNDDVAYNICQTKDQGFIIAGYTTSNNGDVTSNHGSEDYWIVKTDSAGTLEWEKTLGGSQDERAYSIQQTTDGGYVAAGYTKSNNGDVTNNHGNYDYWITKLDSSGTLQWQKTLGGTQSDQAKTIQQTTDGGYITAGFTASVNGDVTMNHGSEDLWMVKLDSAAAIQWQKSFGGSGVDQAYETKQLNNGGYVVAGSSYSLDGDVTGNNGGTDYWVIKTDDAGSLVWEISLGGSSIEEAYSVAPTANSSYVVAGGTLSTDGDVTGNHGDFDYWIVKLTDQVPLPVEEINTDGGKVSLTTAPNPYSGYTTITYELNDRSNVTLEVLNAAGQKVSTLYSGISEKGKYNYLFNAKSLNYPSGMYVVRLITDESVINLKLIEE